MIFTVSSDCPKVTDTKFPDFAFQYYAVFKYVCNLLIIVTKIELAQKIQCLNSVII